MSGSERTIRNYIQIVVERKQEETSSSVTFYFIYYFHTDHGNTIILIKIMMQYRLSRSVSFF